MTSGPDHAVLTTVPQPLNRHTTARICRSAVGEATFWPMLAIARPRSNYPRLQALAMQPEVGALHNGPVLKHVVDARDFTRQWLDDVLFPLSRELQQTQAARLVQPLRDKRLFYLFYESST